MQKRKIDDGKIWDAYERLMAGESLTKVADSEDINLNRRTLRKYIEEVVVPALDADRKAKFEQAMNGNFRGNSTEQKRLKRNNKRKDAEERIKGSEEMKALVGYGVTPAHIEEKCGSRENAIQKLTEDPWSDLKEKDSKAPVQPETESVQSETGRDEN